MAAVRASCTTISAIDLGHIDLEKKSLQPLDNPFGPRSVTPVLGTISVSRLDIGLAEALGPASAELNRAHRPRYVFWGLLLWQNAPASSGISSGLVDAILKGASATAVRERMSSTKGRTRSTRLCSTPSSHHRFCIRAWRCSIARRSRPCQKALLREETKLEAADIFRSLVEKVVVSPVKDGFALNFHGDLAGILALASDLLFDYRG